jgi:RND family efflux transporter MFP subunit
MVNIGFYPAFAGLCLGGLSHGLRLGALCAAAIAATLLVPVAALTHEGHDHGPSEAMGPIAPRISAHSDVYELVAILRADRLVIYLDRFATNQPVTSARIAVTIGDAPDALDAEPTKEGTYAIASPRFRTPGQIELVFSITGETGDDLLPGTLTVPQPANAAPPGASGLRAAWDRIASVFSPRRQASDAHTASTARNSGPAVDAPRRLPDGHAFVPKPTQRLLEVRTEELAPQSAQGAVSLIGRIIADPNRTSLVQSINGGRVMAPDQGLPQIGKTVTKGDLLARIEPTLPQADRTTILEKLGEVEQLIAVAEARLDRIRTLVDKQVTPRSQLIDAEAELEGLRRRRQVLRETRIEPEELRAPTSGVIASARVVPGQVVQAQDVLFHIVDPGSMWVEALVYGELDPASLGQATATAPGRPPLSLRVQGFSRALQQHASIVQFAVENPPANLSIGLPVTVLARIGEPMTGLIVPKDSIVRSGNGEAIVWIHEQAELFEPRPVRVTPFDATHALLMAGASQGDRVVIRAADLVNQVR